MVTIPDPYGRSTFHGKPLDNATIARLEQAEEVLGYDLSIAQGIGGARASGGTHLDGRAVDLAPWDHARKVKVLRDLGFAAWYRPAIAGLWPAHVHAVLIFESRSNRKGIAAAGFDQIGKYDRHEDGLANPPTPDPNSYRPTPPRVFTLAAYRASFAEPKPTRGKRVDEAIAELRAAQKKAKGKRRKKISEAIKALLGIKPR